MSGSASTPEWDEGLDPDIYADAMALGEELGLFHGLDLDEGEETASRYRLHNGHNGSMSDHNEHSLMCMAECNVITADIAEAAARLGSLLDPILDTAVDQHHILGERLSFDLMNACFARSVTDAVFDWLPRVSHFERVNMAYATLLRSASQLREQVDNVAGALVDAHLRTLDLERPRTLDITPDADLADFLIPNVEDLTSRENLDRVYASARHANWITRMDEQYVRMREAIASQSFLDFVRDYRADHARRVATMTAHASIISYPLGLSSTTIPIQNQTGSITVAPAGWTNLSNSITTATIATSQIGFTSFATATTLNTSMQNVPPNWHGALVQCAPPSLASVALQKRKAALLRKEQKAAVRRGKRALNKSIRLYRAFRGDTEIRAFAKGKAFTIKGCLYDYEVMRHKKTTLLGQTMRPPGGIIPYCLTMLTKDGTRLANGCVYFQETPILDQILALALHVQDREEELALHRITVWSGKTLAFDADPLLNVPKPARSVEAIAAQAANLEAWTALSSEWSVRRHGLRQAAMIAVRDDIRSRLSIPLPVIEFMEMPSFGLGHLLRDTPNDDCMRSYAISMDLLRAAMEIDDTDLATTLALISELSGVSVQDLVNPDTVIPGLTTLSGEPFAMAATA